MNLNFSICFAGPLFLILYCAAFCCYSAEETDKFLLMLSKNVFCSKVWLLKMSSDFEELLESFVPRKIRKWQELCKVLINERNTKLVYCWWVFLLKKKVVNKCVKTSVLLNWHIVYCYYCLFLLVTYHCPV